MKKFLKTTIVFLVAVCIFTSAYATFTGVVSLQTNNNEFAKGEEVVVDVKIASIQSDRGIISLGAILEYDKNSLTYVKMEGKNGWETPSYNEANGKLVMGRNSFGSQDETMIQITFKVKQESYQNVAIALKNIAISDGNQETTLTNATKTILIKDGSDNPAPDDNNITNNTTNITNTINNNTVIIDSNNIVGNKTNTVKNNTTANGVLPQTGSNDMILILLIVAVILSVVLYIRKKIIDKKD